MLQIYVVADNINDEKRLTLQKFVDYKCTKYFAKIT